MPCQLCDRDVPILTEHHLVPRQHTKRKKLDPGETIDICPACHRQIHVLFNNRRLAQELNTVEQLKSNPEMAKFLAWVRKQNPDRKVSVKR
ncbi:HNH endonuclease [Leptolyngbya sp. FACHB-17]|uniref:HNH endonuclease n=1 Tax=unclassified Leptolyngbya TaxID=2650499 RepID=UPI0016800638|nr:HNH endonuclease [Leptolyngbya sp. FACHB-17]MBD2081829.1 HNH endonuclease [Leptolyngbya sp. FACHB-17]